MKILLIIISLLHLFSDLGFCEIEMPSNKSEAAVVFKEADGLFLSQEFKKSINFKTVFVEQRIISPVEIFAVESIDANKAEVTIFDPKGLLQIMQSKFSVKLLATSGNVLAEGQGSFKSNTTDSSTGIDTIKVNLDKKVDNATKIILQSTHSAPVQAILRSAVFSAVSGDFAYVKNGEAFLRTPVTLGIRDENFVEIKDGLFEGDEVADGNLETLWVSELQAIRGGVGCAHD